MKVGTRRAETEGRSRMRKAGLPGGQGTGTASRGRGAPGVPEGACAWEPEAPTEPASLVLGHGPRAPPAGPGSAAGTGLRGAAASADCHRGIAQRPGLALGAAGLASSWRLGQSCVSTCGLATVLCIFSPGGQKFCTVETTGSLLPLVDIGHTGRADLQFSWGGDKMSLGVCKPGTRGGTPHS